MKLSSLKDVDRTAYVQRVTSAMQESGGDVNEAARLLGISNRSLFRHLQEPEFAAVYRKPRLDVVSWEEKGRRLARKHLASGIVVDEPELLFELSGAVSEQARTALLGGYNEVVSKKSGQ